MTSGVPVEVQPRAAFSNVRAGLGGVFVDDFPVPPSRKHPAPKPTVVAAGSDRVIGASVGWLVDWTLRSSAAPAAGGYFLRSPVEAACSITSPTRVAASFTNSFPM